MHNPQATKPKEPTTPLAYIPVVLLGLYLLYLIISVPFRAGLNGGARDAVYYTPDKEDTSEEEVFNHQQLIKPSEDAIALGAKIYDANCKSCHGPEGLGNGPSGANLAVKPRNFHESAGWLNGASAVQMYQTLENGAGQGMAAQPQLNPKQKYAVIHFIHAEYMTDYPEPTEEELASLPKPSAGGGSININPYAETRVPIRYAMMKLAAEGEGDRNRQ